jgi:aminopeptidase
LEVSVVVSVDERLERYAELVVRVGVNVQPGQRTFIQALVEHAPVARALARAAYGAGASYVDVLYRDDHVRRALIEFGSDEALTFSPEWQKVFHEEKEGQALLSTTGSPEPDLLAGLDGARVGRAQMREVREIISRQLDEQVLNWCVTAVPEPGWAQQVFGEPDLERLWQVVSHCVRLDEADPVAAWTTHLAVLNERAAALNELRADAIRYRGPGTDLTVGLLPHARWVGGESHTATGIRYVANMPTEEIFTSPDRRRADGTIRCTKPLPVNGQVVRGLQLTFDGGRIVHVEADTGGDVVRSELATDDGASQLGELALVDRSSRVGQTGLIFYEPLLDENATCHLAYGRAYSETFDGEPGEGMNTSAVHRDFMVGGPELEVDALLADGTPLPLLRDDTWQL